MSGEAQLMQQNLTVRWIKNTPSCAVYMSYGKTTRSCENLETSLMFLMHSKLEAHCLLIGSLRLAVFELGC